MENHTATLITAIVSSLGTLITAYYAKFKKDAEIQAVKLTNAEDKFKKDAELQNVKLENTEEKVKHLLHLIENHTQQFDDMEANQTRASLKSYTGMHTALSAAVDKISLALEKKVDKEVLNAQITHILSDMERLMRKNDD